ncbi:hypothetical protein MJ_1386 [Methanocaldococcus jannaschii DSM 2661]|uniref:Uncharacterized protein MJ1386 n=1 Tax=Methanocaldococcus jannaschii (strain ATCC 43067 / DSM 2661 / JAL-1 / JCM 10045 / NBRC 100440) TaxID=243232 RepID=Y1386_METJA|nr:RecName: Full=Uncharacterized protein MJ1386 [Methanocaldococcus jannaschii DSM 2661]AAB99399.1 hypothetical protein MJ_1386 [Methanocaldococcus jannaschii DSM 2661]
MKIYDAVVKTTFQISTSIFFDYIYFFDYKGMKMAEIFAVNNYTELKKIRRMITFGFTVLGLGIGMIFGDAGLDV